MYYGFEYSPPIFYETLISICPCMNKYYVVSPSMHFIQYVYMFMTYPILVYLLL